jgi:hypothetical protein
MREKIDFRKRAKEKLSIGEGFEKFIALKKAMKLSARSIVFYGDCFKYFTEFCNRDTLAEKISRDTIIERGLGFEKPRPRSIFMLRNDKNVDMYRV